MISWLGMKNMEFLYFAEFNMNVEKLIWKLSSLNNTNIDYNVEIVSLLYYSLVDFIILLYSLKVHFKRNNVSFHSSSDFQKTNACMNLVWNLHSNNSNDAYVCNEIL